MGRGGRESFTQPILIELNKKDRSPPSRLVSRTLRNVLVLYEVYAKKICIQQMTDDLMNQVFQIWTEKECIWSIRG